MMISYIGIFAVVAVVYVQGQGDDFSDALGKLGAEQPVCVSFVFCLFCLFVCLFLSVFAMCLQT